MSVLDDAPEQMVQVYRGLANVEPGGVDLTNLGTHWTTNRRVAKSFTDSGEPGRCGALVCARVRRADVLPADHPEAVLAGVESTDSPEQEVFVRRAATVWIASITYVYDESEEEFAVSGRNAFGAA